jgi:hypothetical protein
MSQNKSGVAPHEGEELTLVMMGVKPAAIIERDKQPEMYDKAQSLCHVISVYQLDVGIISVTKPENAHLHATIELLGSPNAKIVVRSTAEKQRLLGRILGYSEEQIDEFVRNPPECDCRWCIL